MPTNCFLTPAIVAVNSVGVAPKSLSPIWSFWGTCQEASTARSETRNLTMAGAYGSALEQGPGLPVDTYRVPAAVSRVGELQMEPPWQPLGTVSKVWVIAPVLASSCTSFPCTSGQSAKEETPSYTLPSETVGELHRNVAGGVPSTRVQMIAPVKAFKA